MLSSYYYTDKGGRSENEDCCRVFGNDYDDFCAVVCDGLGGHGGGGLASRAAAESFEKTFKSERIRDPNEFNVWFQIANQNVLEIQTDECKMKTTAVVLVISDRKALWAHVGDTRLYHFVNNRLVEQTFDHSVSQMAVLSGEIGQREIRGHADRNKLLRALGRDDRIDTEISGVLSVEGGRHAFLLCTDGFWEYVFEDEMEQALAESEKPREWMKKMVEKVKKRAKKGSDNRSAIAVFV